MANLVGGGSNTNNTAYVRYIAPNGEERTGYIVEGKTFDLNTQARIPVNSIVETVNGDVYRMTNNGGEKLDNVTFDGVKDNLENTIEMEDVSFEDLIGEEDLIDSGYLPDAEDGSDVNYVDYLDPQGTLRQGFISNGITYDVESGDEVTRGSYVKTANGDIYMKGSGGEGILVNDMSWDDIKTELGTTNTDSYNNNKKYSYYPTSDGTGIVQFDIEAGEVKDILTPDDFSTDKIEQIMEDGYVEAGPDYVDLSDSSDYLEDKEEDETPTNPPDNNNNGGGGSPSTPDQDISFTELDRLNPEAPNLRDGDTLSDLYGITNDRSEIEQILLDAVDAKNNVALQQQGINEDKFYDDLARTQNTVLDTLGLNNLNAIKTGAAKGATAANELSAILGLEDRAMEGVNQLAADRKLLADQMAADTAAAKSSALDQANSTGIKLGETAANILNADMVGYGSELNYDAQIANILGNIEAQKIASQAQVDSARTSANATVAASRSSGYTPGNASEGEDPMMGLLLGLPKALQLEYMATGTLSEESMKKYPDVFPQKAEEEDDENDVINNLNRWSNY